MRSIRHLFTVPATLLALAACRAAPDAAQRAATKAHAAVDADTAGCALVAVAAHPEPEALLREFVRRDSAGEFTRASAWFNGAVDCPGHEPGPDGATMVKSFSLQVLSRDADAMRAEVRWERVGYFGAGADVVAPGVDLDTLTAVRTPYGWRIRSPALNPHVPVPPPPPREESDESLRPAG